MQNRFLSKKYWNAVSTPLGESADLAKKYDDLINLSLGDPDLTTNSEIIDAALKDAYGGYTRYGDSAGDPELREEISSYYKDKYDYDIQINEIMIVVGACHGMYLALQAVLDEGDEVIVPEPYFTPYSQQIQAAGGKIVPLETFEEDGFQINIDRLKNLINHRTKAIIINTPNNPTGACLDKSTLEALAEVAINCDLLILADDVYGAFSFNEPFIPITTIPGMKERTITISSFSKDYCMTGWRIGYILAEHNIISCIRDINEGITYTAPSISQRAALHALRLRNAVQPEIVNEYKKRLLYTYERINRIPWMSVQNPGGSIYLFPSIKKTGLTSAEFSKKLLEEAHVLAVPGNAFGSSGEGYIRIACTVGIDKLKTAFDRIENSMSF